jgi:sporulation protein YlmC with PRC-barrel domain
MTGVLSTSTISGDKVCNLEGEDLGKIEDLVLDLDSGRVAYAVLSFGGFMGMGNKLFALPWESLAVDKGEHRIVLNVPKEKLENAEGFDKDNWPDFADPAFRDRTYSYYGAAPWESGHTATRN